MAKELRIRRGTTAQHSTFTGAPNEVTADTTKKTLVLHDGTTVGGVPMARENLANVPAGSVATAMMADGAVTAAKMASGAAAGNLGFTPANSTATVNLTGDQTINGTKTFVNGVRFNDGSTQTSAASGGGIRFTRYGPGTYTFTVPAGVTSLFVTVIGGAGGGVRYTDSYGTYPRDGRMGGFGQRWITGLTPGQTISVTVGAGGTAVSTGSIHASSSSGGVSSFGTFVTSTGGPGFTFANESVVGSSSVSGADIAFSPNGSSNSSARGAYVHPGAGTPIPGGFNGNGGLVVVQF